MRENLKSWGWVLPILLAVAMIVGALWGLKWFTDHLEAEYQATIEQASTAATRPYVEEYVQCTRGGKEKVLGCKATLVFAARELEGDGFAQEVTQSINQYSKLRQAEGGGDETR